ncbi:Gnk2-homologous domain [Dillenia turbinata]|uniref:Gnk2-homologous domain n=1 Tax=Dillenia turbinata TaxID=194707 RepID=A0AAN8Z1L9_9MAGN
MKDEIGDKARNFPVDLNFPRWVCQNCHLFFSIVGMDSYGDKFLSLYSSSSQSDQNFIGTLDQIASMGISNDTFDNVAVVSKGLGLMSGLARTAPNEPLMFQASVLDVGINGKRYGMAQCTRDISMSDCGNCLDHLLANMVSVENKRGWEIYALSCSMWNHDYQFYFNFTTTSQDSGASRPTLSQGFTIGIAAASALSVLLLVIQCYLATDAVECSVSYSA